MPAQIMNGEVVAARIRGEVAEAVAELQRAGIQPGLGTILVGDDLPSARYVAMKIEDCAEVGIVSVHEHLPADVLARQDAFEEQIRQTIPLGRGGTVDEVASTTAFLASDDASYITGQVVSVNGGSSML